MGTFDWHSDVEEIGLFGREDGLAALGLWMMAGAWTGSHGRTGFVTHDCLRDLHTNAVESDGPIKLLIEVGLWAPEDGGWRMLRGPHADPDLPLPLWRYSDTDLGGRLFGFDDTPND